MLRPGEMQFLGRGFENGIPVTWLIDYYGKRWTAFDFEALRRQEDQRTRAILNHAHRNGERPKVVCHKKKRRRR